MGTGCSASYEIKDRAELQECEGKYRIRALTVDTLLYTFEKFSFTNTELAGSGTLKRGNRVEPFEGSVPFSRIVFIEGLEMSFWKGVWVFPVLSGCISGVESAFSSHSSFEIHRIGGSSCPYVYSYDGSSFRLDAEAFGTSVSKAFEAETYSVLPSLVPVSGHLDVRISNERPETHLINSVHLYVGDAGGVTSAVLDVNNVLWPVENVQPPSAAHDHSGNDILAEISAKDNRRWQSDLANTTANSGFRDELNLQFDRPDGASDATLVVDAINSDLVTEAYRAAGSVLGDATMQFYRALEHDPQLQARIRDWIRDCSLRIEEKEGNEWKVVGSMEPEASVAPFSRAIRIHHLNDVPGPLMFRLSSLTDVWRIDAVQIDFSTVKPIPLRPLSLASVKASDGNDWGRALANYDTSYAILFPPNHLDLTFDASTSTTMRKPLYVFAARGYLYEWLPSATPGNPSASTSSIGADVRIELFKSLINHKEFFLPSVYAEWRDHGSFQPTQSP